MMKCPLIVFVDLSCEISLLFCRENEGNDKAVETQHLGKNEDQNHSNEKPKWEIWGRKKRLEIASVWLTSDSATESISSSP